MVEKSIKGVICHAIHRYAEANKTYITDYDKNKESSYLTYLTYKGFKWVEETYQFNEDFIKIYNDQPTCKK